MFFFSIFKISIFIILFFYHSLIFSAEINVNKIEFFGLSYLSELELLNKVKSKLDYNNISIDEFLLVLSDIRVFEKIDLIKSDETLKLFVTEKPYINNIDVYCDNDKNYIYSVLNEFNLNIGWLYDSYSLELFKQKVEQYYINQGMNSINVDYFIDSDVLTNSVSISINLSNYEKLRIKEIKIFGNKSFKEKELLSFFFNAKTSWMTLFSDSDIYIKGKLISDLELLRTYYFDNGFVNFQISSAKVLISKNKKYAYIFINVFEGDQYYIGDVVLDDNFSFFKERFQPKLNSTFFSGEVFSLNKIFEFRKYLKDYLSDRGYIGSDIDFNLIDLEENVIDIEFFLGKLSRLIVRKIDFSGNFLTDDYILRRLIPQIEGNYILMSDVNDGKDEILRSGIVSEVDVEFKNYSSDNNYVDILYKIKEQKLTKFTAGFTMTHADGLVINIGSEFINFLGTGRDVSINVNKNRLQSDYNFIYFDPCFFNINVGFGYNIYYKIEDLDKYSGFFDHASNVFGWNIYYSLKLDDLQRLNFGLGCDMTKLNMYGDAAPIEVKDFISHEGCFFKEYYLTSTFAFNSLDRYNFPIDGLSSNLILKLSVPPSDIKYYSLNFSLNFFNNFAYDYIFNINSTINYGNVYGSTFCYPFFKNFFMRGSNCIRGFKDKTIGPKDSNGESFGGNLLLNFRLSIINPIPFIEDLDTIRTSLFLDFGQVYTINNIDDFLSSFKDNFSLKYSCGLCITWNTPFGVPFELSLAYPINMDKYERKNIISFIFGVQH